MLPGKGNHAVKPGGIGAQQRFKLCRGLLHHAVKAHEIPAHVVDGCPLGHQVKIEGAAAKKRLNIPRKRRNHAVKPGNLPGFSARPFEKRLHMHPSAIFSLLYQESLPLPRLKDPFANDVGTWYHKGRIS